MKKKINPIILFFSMIIISVMAVMIGCNKSSSSVTTPTSEEHREQMKFGCRG